MKASVIASLFFALVVSANDCVFWNSCYCTSADGTPADAFNAEQACLQFGSASGRIDAVETRLDGGISKCFGKVVEAGTIFHLDNCVFQDGCAARGFTGAPVCEGRFS
ncbi:hypothetical protein LZ30DRAFT_711271 [Colletotrichum cereale]|nr:hypothetical protein LZ30DRAFT_711271 [Colletotrichum cereale]